ncbi:NAD-dependent epimerase/dehydratase family protein [Arthrospiribacter ruber]|uniref:NAD-dependent epimerase/dehydratase family protein n=1 Tax=Arthrospiribacter ruber TaxID=2487934 RepID=A0A951ME93_9BACT|nr:NAD-dependent epimerase/dehydratase family protein [Arthrospiribacter ruber]MBW3468310.1 NAD-dependent epimerase/dehydratase family protein [Arthrospiribacter ruber]
MKKLDDMNQILKEDLNYIFEKLDKEEKSKFNNATVLLTGCGGFLGYYFMHFLNRYSEELHIKQIIGLDNFLTGTKDWLEKLAKENPKISLHTFDVIKDDPNQIKGIENADLIIHGASIASPTFYRIYPLETIDANITGLRRLLDFYCNKPIKGFLFFSSSEIYGDPFPEYIPTAETYRGNVSTMGPRACYDEAKRFGETLCYVFHEKYNMPISIARPFNNYGPGMNINDKRLPADFAKCVHEGRDLIMYSDGKPTRTFCYISDAITGYLKVLCHGKLDVFNIGIDNPEISVKEFANLFIESAKEVYNYKGKAIFQTSDDSEYLTDNPNRRCPDISKAKELLGYSPDILVNEGVKRFLTFLNLNEGRL